MTALKPLTDGVIVLAGVKASNMPEEIRTHPRVVVWDSQEEHWTSKELPANARAVFTTRWISHPAFGNIVRQTRARHITLFNSVSTGVMNRQVKELLDLNSVHPVQTDEKETKMTTQTTEKKVFPRGVTGNKKLDVFIPHIDWTKSNIENARNIMPLVPEVETTLASLANFIGTERRKRNEQPSPKAFLGIGRGRKPVIKVETTTDLVGVQLVDKLIQDLTELRTYFTQIEKENQKLHSKLDKFKKFFED